MYWVALVLSLPLLPCHDIVKLLSSLVGAITMHVTQKATTTTTSDCPVPSKVSSVSLICSSSDGCYGCPCCCCCCSARYVEPQMKEMSCDMTMRRIHMQGTYHFDIGTYKNKNNILCVIHVCVDMCHGRRRWLIKIIKCKCSAAN